MENPYCSCKPARVRHSAQVRSRPGEADRRRTRRAGAPRLTAAIPMENPYAAVSSQAVPPVRAHICCALLSLVAGVSIGGGGGSGLSRFTATRALGYKVPTPCQLTAALGILQRNCSCRPWLACSSACCRLSASHSSACCRPGTPTARRCALPPPPRMPGRRRRRLFDHNPS